MDEIVRIRQVWSRIAPTPTRFKVAASPPQYAADWYACVESLRHLFASYYGAAAVARRFVVPTDYAAFMSEIGGGWYQSAGLGRDIYAAATVAKDTAEDFRLFVSERYEDEDPEDDGIWLTIGWYGDKHAMLLCCDRAHSHYGRVIDYHDSHPWLNGVICGSLLLGDSWLDWLERMAGITDRESN